MKHSNIVFVLSNNNQSTLVDTLFNLGYIPILRGAMLEALNKIRHEGFAAIFVDRHHINEDVLEFILNVRDIDAQISVVVVGESENRLEDKAIVNQHNIYLLKNNYKLLEREIEEII